MNGDAVAEAGVRNLLIATTPGPFGAWIVKAAQKLASAVIGRAVDIIELDSDAATDTFLANPSTAVPTILASRYPRKNLVDHLERNGGEAIIVVDDPRDVVLRHTVSGKMSTTDALKPLCQSLALLDEVRRLRARLVLAAEQFERPVVRTLADLALMLGAGPSDGVPISNAFQGWFGGSVLESVQDIILNGKSLIDARSNLSGDEARTIAEVADGLVDLLKRGNGTVIWKNSLFYDGVKLTSPAPAIVDLTGSARCIYYGPYLYLPAGSWEGSLHIGFSDQISDTRLRVELYTNAVDASFLSRVTRGGIFRMPIQFTVVDARLPIQFRIFIDRGEIDGLFAFKQVVLRPAAAALAAATPTMIAAPENSA